MQLNGWQRFGIVLSIIWAAGASIQQRNNDIQKAESYAKFSSDVCLKSKTIANNLDTTSCEQERQNGFKLFMDGSWSNVAAIALIPIPLGWLAAFIILNCWKAVSIGLRAVIPWAELSTPRKGFVIFCFLVTGLTVISFMIFVMNLYVDTKVPVGIANNLMVIHTGSDDVTAEGTWTRSGLNDGSSMGFPLQTSRIDCNRKQNLCTEARVEVSGNILMTPEILNYDIDSWSDTTIVFKSDAPCAEEIYTIDLKTDSVNGVGKLINQDTKYCQTYGIKETNWSYHLSDGFKVYWAERLKARPLPLKIIQTLLGN